MKYSRKKIDLKAQPSCLLSFRPKRFTRESVLSLPPAHAHDHTSSSSSAAAAAAAAPVPAHPPWPTTVAAFPAFDSGEEEEEEEEEEEVPVTGGGGGG